LKHPKLEPLSQVLLEIEKPLQDQLITDSGLKLYIDPTYKKEWQASVTARIAKLPSKYSPKEKAILDQLKVGDEVAVSFRVVADFEFKGDGHRFMPSREDNKYVREYFNGRGEWLSMYALQKRSGFTDVPMWAGILQDKYRNFVDGTQGSEEQVERWLSQFPMGKTDDYTFANFFEQGGNDYWKCDIGDIFAKKVKGHLVAVGNRVICKPIDESVPVNVAILLNPKGDEVKIRHQDRGRVLSGGKSIGVKRDQTVSFQPNHCEKYSFWGKDYYLIRDNLVCGVWN
jgi:hypothetical protein